MMKVAKVRKSQGVPAAWVQLWQILLTPKNERRKQKAEPAGEGGLESPKKR